jgi:lipopolysaccharide/colanic/teichoic acid biosynthesis glycosyltransferase
MHMNERDGVLFKISNDPRITKLGRFCASIRSTSCRSSSTCCAAT